MNTKSCLIAASACLLAAACASEPGVTSDQSSEQAAEASSEIGAGAAATMSVTQSWETGFCVDLTVWNGINYPSDSWSVILRMPAIKSGTFNGQNGTYSLSGEFLRIDSVSYNKTIAPHEGIRYDQRPQFCVERPTPGAEMPSVVDVSMQYCGTIYTDADGDGYGDESTARQTCGPVPEGSTAVGGDCCDSDSRTHVDQMGWFYGPDACGSKDYNCDGSLECATGKCH